MKTENEWQSPAYMAMLDEVMNSTFVGAREAMNFILGDDDEHFLLMISYPVGRKGSMRLRTNMPAKLLEDVAEFLINSAKHKREHDPREQGSPSPSNEIN